MFKEKVKAFIEKINITYLISKDSELVNCINDSEIRSFIIQSVY